MTLLETWRKVAYESQQDEVSANNFWNEYFMQEKSVYEKLLSNPDEVYGSSYLCRILRWYQ